MIHMYTTRVDVSAKPHGFVMCNTCVLNSVAVAHECDVMQHMLMLL